MLQEPLTAEECDATSISPDAIRAQLARICRHPYFVRSARVRRFLEFTVGYVLSGRTSELKEYLLGVEVFDRTAAHDPRLDPIVRVEARRVRAKLSSYYDSDGAGDELVIEYPCGSYVPRFRLQENAWESPVPALIAVLPFAPQRERSRARFTRGSSREVINESDRPQAVRAVSGQNHRATPALVEALLTGTVRRNCWPRCREGQGEN